MAKAFDEKKELWKRTAKLKARGRHLDVGLLHLYGQKKKAARRAVNKVRNNMEEECTSWKRMVGGR